VQRVGGSSSVRLNGHGKTVSAEDPVEDVKGQNKQLGAGRVGHEQNPASRRDAASAADARGDAQVSSRVHRKAGARRDDDHRPGLDREGDGLTWWPADGAHGGSIGQPSRSTVVMTLRRPIGS
jgi:hypothetical protein